MFILSPKTHFLGGALVSASHLGKLFPGKLLTWKQSSPFLDTNNVSYKVVDNIVDYPVDNFSSIWCNDTCINEGYYPHLIEKNEELWNFLKNFDTVHLFNHQPINRYFNYLYDMLSYLVDQYKCKVTIWNYRACWNIEFENELKSLFPSVECYTAPYHYYLGQVPDIDKLVEPNKTVCCIGRSNSKCKIQYKLDVLKTVLPCGVDSLLPDSNVGNEEFLEKLRDYKYILTGYYYGGEGNPEMKCYYNKLEWSFMDALLSGVIPMTNTLFRYELERLNIPAPMIGYRYFGGIDNTWNYLKGSLLNNKEILIQSRISLINEIKKGNLIMSKILTDK